MHVYDYTKMKGSNYSKLIFNVKSNANAATHPTCLDASYERFCESVFTQQDSITAIEKCEFDPRVFLSTSKDGSIAIWRFEEETSPNIAQENVIKQVAHIYPQDLL